MTQRGDDIPAERDELVIAGRDLYTVGRDLTVNNYYPTCAEVQDRGVSSGAPMVVGDLPQQPQGFQPRTGLLSQLGRHGTEGVRVHVVTGIRGSGKTQLAAAFAREKLAFG